MKHPSEGLRPEGGDAQSARARAEGGADDVARLLAEPLDQRNDHTLNAEDRRGASFEDLEGATGVAVVYRPDRYNPADLGQVEVLLTVAAYSGEAVECQLVNVSQTGVAFVASPERSFVPNDVLGLVTLSFDGYKAYEGGAVIRDVRRVGDTKVVGAEFLYGLIAIDDFLRLRDLKVAQREAMRALAQPASAWQSAGHYEFKARVAELSLFLQAAKKQLDRLEASLEWEDIHGDGDTPVKRQLIKGLDSDLIRAVIAWSEEINALYAKLDSTEADLLKPYARSLLHHLVLDAPIVRRAYEKPSGYAGDYFVMSYLYDDRRFEGSTLFAKALHRATCNQTAGQAVRERKEMLKQCIRRRIDSWTSDRPLRCVSIASGPAQEFAEVLTELPRDAPAMEIVLFDQDRQALQTSQSRLLSLIRQRRLDSVRVIALHDAIKSLIAGGSVLESRGPFDLCLMAGLMDYLLQSVGRRLVASLHQLLAPGGECWAGNVAPWNPSRWAMEHLYDWYIIVRSDLELLDLATEIDAPVSARVVKSDLGLVPFLVVQRDC